MPYIPQEDLDRILKPRENRKEEVINIKLRPDGHTEQVVHSSKGCQHIFRQVESNKSQCELCGLGLFGLVSEINKQLTREVK